jgi:hypothetical protein
MVLLYSNQKSNTSPTIKISAAVVLMESKKATIFFSYQTTGIVWSTQMKVGKKVNMLIVQIHTNAADLHKKPIHRHFL